MTTALPPEFLRLPVAHRALHDRAAGQIENSLSAIAAAVAAGYAIEIDIQPSSDGVPMVFHDDTLERLTAAEGPIRDRSAAELSALRLTGGTDTIPTLAAVLDAVAGRVPLLVEIKDQDGTLGPNVGPLEEAAAEILRGYQGPLAVMSFNPHAVGAFGLAAPGIALGLTTCAFDANDWGYVHAARRMRLAAIADYDAVGASFISHYHRDLASPRVAALKDGGAGILCWTIRSAADEAAARRIADNITFEGYPASLPGDRG